MVPRTEGESDSRTRCDTLCFWSFGLSNMPEGKHVLDSLPENDEACTELLEVLIDWLPRRYPTMFESIDCPGGGIWNKVTNERFKDVSQMQGVDALRVISR
jgi:hypothetical protein